MEDVTHLLQEVRSGNAEAMSRLITLVHRELHRIAGQHMRKEAPGHTIQPTALVNEAYLQLVAQRNHNWQNRAHFFAVAATLMRRILIDYARARTAAKRGHGQSPLRLDEVFVFTESDCEQAVVIDQALDRLAQQDARMAQIVEMRFFGGLTEEEIAEALQVSSRTVKRDWKIAKLFLQAELASRA